MRKEGWIVWSDQLKRVGYVYGSEKGARGALMVRTLKDLLHTSSEAGEGLIEHAAAAVLGASPYKIVRVTVDVHTDGGSEE